MRFAFRSFMVSLFSALVVLVVGGYALSITSVGGVCFIGACVVGFWLYYAHWLDGFGGGNDSLRYMASLVVVTGMNALALYSMYHWGMVAGLASDTAALGAGVVVTMVHVVGGNNLSKKQACAYKMLWRVSGWLVLLSLVLNAVAYGIYGAI